MIRLSRRRGRNDRVDFNEQICFELDGEGHPNLPVEERLE